MRTFNTVIIGFGKGGKTAAGFLAKHGEKVALIEADETMYGGTCINVGCIPSKSLVTWANRAYDSKEFPTKEEYFQAAIARKRLLVETLRGKNYHKIADLENVEVINGRGSFEDDHRIKITFKDGSNEVIYGDKIIINTGATSVVPNIEGLILGERIKTSEGLLNLDELPAHLVILGGGYIGLEFAAMYAKFGSKVTILEAGTEFLSREDRDIAETIAENLRTLGVQVLTEVQVNEVKEDLNKVNLITTIGGKAEVVSGDILLVATGRKPNTEGLNLEHAGIAVNERGAIIVDDSLHTSVEHIWAFGDVNGGLQFTYISLDDFRIFKEEYLGLGKRSRTVRNVPYSVFLNTPLGRVGLTEAQAKAQGLDYQVVKLPVAAIPKANVLQRPQGILKAIVENNTGKILGAALLCEEAHELINIIALTMNLGGNATTLKNQIFTHPTMAEALNDLFELVK